MQRRTALLQLELLIFSTPINTHLYGKLLSMYHTLPFYFAWFFRPGRATCITLPTILMPAVPDFSLVQTAGRNINTTRFRTIVWFNYYRSSSLHSPCYILSDVLASIWPLSLTLLVCLPY